MRGAGRRRRRSRRGRPGRSGSRRSACPGAGAGLAAARLGSGTPASGRAPRRATGAPATGAAPARGGSSERGARAASSSRRAVGVDRASSSASSELEVEDRDPHVGLGRLERAAGDGPHRGDRVTSRACCRTLTCRTCVASHGHDVSWLWPCRRACRDESRARRSGPPPVDRLRLCPRSRDLRRDPGKCGTYRRPRGGSIRLPESSRTSGSPAVERVRAVAQVEWLRTQRCARRGRVGAATSSTSRPVARGDRGADDATNAGSFVLPRCGTGARYGESVSTSTRSDGASAAAARTSSAVLNVTMPLNDR